jgi:hypothetical protein
MGQISGLWTQGLEWKWCLGEPISNLRLFLSAKGLLGCVKKLQSVWYLAIERESIMHEVFEPLDLVWRKGDPSRPSDLEKVQESYLGNLSGIRLLVKTRCADARTPDTRKYKLLIQSTPYIEGRKLDRWIKKKVSRNFAISPIGKSDMC